MDVEPITLFSYRADLTGVARLLRESGAAVVFEGPDDDWRKATVTLGKLWRKRKLTLNYKPDYLAGEKGAAQMSGMRGYLSRWPSSPRQAAALGLPTTFRFSLGVIFEPDFDPDGDPRLDLLFRVAALLDAVLFTPSSLRDASGRVLYSALGAEEEDPTAVWPKVRLAMQVEPVAEVDEDEEDAEDESDPRTAQRVARRALALAALSNRAFLEQDPTNAANERERSQLLEWVRAAELEAELEEDEREFLQRPVGTTDPQAAVNAMWRVEGLVVLAWALGCSDLPDHDGLVDLFPLWRSVGLLFADEALDLVREAELPERTELEALKQKLFALHWRLRDFHLHPKTMDFAGFARTCWFGPLDLSGVPLVDGDLAIGGLRIDQADPDLLSAAHSAAQERHLAINWLLHGPETYSDASVAT